MTSLSIGNILERLAFAMTELNYKSLNDHLEELAPKPRLEVSGRDRPLPAVYLIYGEEMLCKAAFKKVLDKLVPESKQSFNFESIEGTDGVVSEAIEKLNTYSLLSGPRVVGLMDARIFDSKTNAESIFLSAVAAYENQNLKRSAVNLLRYMSLVNHTFDELSSPNRRKIFPAGCEHPEDDRWLDDVMAFCQANGLQIPQSVDNESLLCRAIENGFPAGNRLIITTDTVDKRRKLFKTIQKQGLIIDCSVPKGDRKADKIAQEAVFSDTVEAVLGGSGKSMANDACQELLKMTGFELRTIVNNLEKLVNYVGDRKHITQKDVISALKRTKKDPIYAFTGAFNSRNLDDTLFYMNTLMSEGQGALRPEQVLVALLNQIRKLLLVKEFVSGPLGKIWYSGCPYNIFRIKVMPAVQKFDEEWLEMLGKWQTSFEELNKVDVGPGGKKRRGQKRSPSKTDLMIARYPHNPYPIYQLFLSAQNYSKQDLLQAYEYLSKADLQIKSGSDHKRLILEEVILKVCQRRDAT